MGWKVTPQLLKLMDPEDQARYGPGIHPESDCHPPSKTDALERDEQRQFASWLMLNDLLPPAVWHRTDKRSTGTLGCPDFIVPVHGQVLFIEFKRGGFHLSPDQKLYEASLSRQEHTLYIAYSALEAIELVRPYVRDLDTL